jgi:hypothetical protein
MRRSPNQRPGKIMTLATDRPAWARELQAAVTATVPEHALVRH